MIFYAGYTVEMHGLSLANQDEIEVLGQKIREAVAALHPSLNYDSDVSVECFEYGEQPDEG